MSPQTKIGQIEVVDKIPRTAEDVLCQLLRRNQLKSIPAIGMEGALFLPSVAKVLQIQSASDTPTAINVNDVVIPVNLPLNFLVDRSPRPEDQPEDLRREIIALKSEIRAHCDKIRRFENVIADEVLYWERGLSRGEWDSLEQRKRRLSVLRGAVAYSGRTCYHVPPCNLCSRLVSEHPCDISPQARMCSYHPDTVLQSTIKWECHRCHTQFSRKEKQWKDKIKS